MNSSELLVGPVSGHLGLLNRSPGSSKQNWEEYWKREFHGRKFSDLHGLKFRGSSQGLTSILPASNESGAIMDWKFVPVAVTTGGNHVKV